MKPLCLIALALIALAGCASGGSPGGYLPTTLRGGSDPNKFQANPGSWQPTWPR